MARQMVSEMADRCETMKASKMAGQKAKLTDSNWAMPRVTALHLVRMKEKHNQYFLKESKVLWNL
jgi:hypothetical protein